MTTTNAPFTYVADLKHLPRALQHLTGLKRWVVWRWEQRINKKTGAKEWTKPPYQCVHYKTHAKSNDPSTWGTYEAALAAVAAGRANGIGFMLKDSEVAAADLDHVRDAQTGELVGWARGLCAEADQLGLYREITVSGCGLRFIGLANGSDLQRKFTFDHATQEGIELFRNTERYITISGLQQGICEKLPPIDDYLNRLLARYDGAANFDFNTAGTQTDYYRDLIENGAPDGERSEKFQEVVWHLASSGYSAEQIADELAKHPNGIGLKYASRLLAEVTRSFSKWQGQRRTNATGSRTTNVTPWPQIKVIPGERPRIVNEAEDALILLGHEIYQRNGMIVRPVLNRSLKTSDGGKTESWQLIEVTHPYLVEELCRAAQFQHYDKRTKKFVSIDAPDNVAKAYLNRQGHWKLPHLIGVVNAPFLRVNGSICEIAGYDPDSYVLFKPESQFFPPVPQNPSKADAEVALAKLCKLIESFPFVTTADQSVALAAMLTALDRRSMSTAPLIGFSAPAARTGKSLLVKLMGILATGRAVPTKSQGNNEEEFEKRLGGNLLAGDVCISIDNCSRPLSGDMLCSALTEDEIDVRVLGRSRNIKTATIATIFATGNNLIIAGDLTARCLVCMLDAKVERPGLRKFNIDVAEEVRVRRGELVVAALTVLRAWHTTKERIHVDALGGFEEWSYRVREPLIWLGKVDPCDTIERVRENDPELDALTVVLAQWKECLGTGSRHSVSDVIGRALLAPAFYEALKSVALSRSGGTVNNDRLGWYLKRVQGKIINGLKIVKAGTAHGYTEWMLT